jgi:arylsulfatase A-like enzyme
MLFTLWMSPSTSIPISPFFSTSLTTLRISRFMPGRRIRRNTEGDLRIRDGDKLRRERYQRMLKIGLIDKKWALSPSDVPEWETYDEAMRDELDLKMSLYSAMIDRMDQNIGRVVEKLRASGRLDNTLILFMVDNGVPGTGVHDWRGLFAKNDRNPKPGWTITRSGGALEAGPRAPAGAGPT